MVGRSTAGRAMRRLTIIAVFLACTIATAARAEFPDRPIHLVVPQAAGSATDTVARILAAALGDEIGQQVIVDDRPGGALTVGLDLTAKSPPDGYTLCMGPIGALAITPHLVAKLPYDIAHDFQPIVLLLRGQEIECNGQGIQIGAIAVVDNGAVIDAVL